MTYTLHNYSPSVMIDLATLTGACVVALGEETSGIFANNKNLLMSCRILEDITRRICGAADNIST